MTDPVPLDVTVLVARGAQLLALVDGVRVRVRARKPLPRWLCDEHPDPDGRTSCAHIDALAETIPTPEQLDRITDERERRRNTR